MTREKENNKAVRIKKPLLMTAAFRGDSEIALKPREKIGGREMKQIGVKAAGDDTKTFSIMLYPGATARDVLQQCRLPGFRLLKHRDSLEFAEGQNIYREVDDGGEIVASPKMEAGGLTASLS